jgi:DNA polymerase-3 subunit gamma/tau
MVRNLRTIATREGVTIDDESLHVIASKADGAMRDALTIFDQTVAFCGTEVKYDDVIRNLGVLDYEYSFSMVENFLTGNYGAALLSFDEILAKGFNALHFVASLSSHLRDLIVAKTGGLDALLELPESLKQRYREQAAKCDIRFLFDALGITTGCESAYKSAVNPRLHIEYAIMKLSFLTNAPVAQPAPVKEISPRASLGRDDKPVISSTQQPVISSGAEGVVEKSPAPRRRAAKTGSALSMNALMEEKKEEEKPAEAAPVATQLPDDDTVRLQWKELSKQYADKPRLASTIANGHIEVSEDGGVKIVDFIVKNEAQKQWIEDKLLRDLENKLRGLLNTPKVNILVSVTPEEEVERQPYMPEEKAKDLMDKNPAFKAFAADLGLDTK